MSLEYVERRIKEALQQSKGSVAKAQRLIIEWAHDDEKLMQSLVKPHLGGIVAYNIERVASGRSEKSKPAQKSASGKKLKGEEFGLEILKAIAADQGVRFGLESGGAPVKKRGAASQSHIEALKAIAAGPKPAGKSKKK